MDIYDIIENIDIDLVLETREAMRNINKDLTDFRLGELKEKYIMPDYLILEWKSNKIKPNKQYKGNIETYVREQIDDLLYRRH